MSFAHDFMVRTAPRMCTPTYVYVYAWHTYALAPFKMAKRVNQVEEKKTRRLNLPEIAMQKTQKAER